MNKEKIWDINSLEYKNEVKRIEEQDKKEQRITEINTRLDKIVFEMGKNNLFYKDAKNYQQYHDDLLNERNALILELKSLI